MAELLLARRTLLKGLALAALAGRGANVAAAPALAATTFPGAWEQSHRAVLLPAARRATGAAPLLSASQAVDTVAKLAAARAHPPFDVVMLDEGPYLAALELDLFEPLPAAAMPNLAQLPARFIDPRGLGAFVSAQVFGIAYNSERLKTPPTGWQALASPQYRGRVGLVGLGATLGLAWMVELARLGGGDEDNLDPAFALLRRILPNVGAVAANPGALGALFQQGQIDIAVHYLNNVEVLKARGVPIALARPDSGWGLVRSSMHIVKGTRAKDAAAAYVNTALSAEVQTALTAAPYFIAPTNRNVAFGSALAAIAPDAEALAALYNADWARLNPHRGAYIDRFNRTVRG